jgi:hypothetical protein
MTVDLVTQQSIEAERPDSTPRIVLGLLLAGRWANEVAAGLGKTLEQPLVSQHPSVRWGPTWAPLCSSRDERCAKPSAARKRSATT